MADIHVDGCMDTRQKASRQKQMVHKVCSQIDRIADLTQQARNYTCEPKAKEPGSQMLGTRIGSGSYLLPRHLKGGPAHDTKACGLSCLTLPQSNLHASTAEFAVDSLRRASA